MLVIRMQRTGRKGHAMFRVIVQDSRRTPTSGKIVAQLGSYDPHQKNVTLNKERAEFYLEHGAQPSDRVARLLKAEGLTLPDWVKPEADKQRTVRHADKRRSTRPAEEKPTEGAAPEEPVEAAKATIEEAPAEIPAEDAPAEEAPAVEEAVPEPEETAAAEPTPEEDSADKKAA